MARARERADEGPPSMISIIGPGMKVLGDCSTEGTVRIEGVVRGEIFAGKAIVVGKDGIVTGDLRTHDAVIAGTVEGAVHAASRLEIQATARIRGEVHARRLQLEEGAVLNGEVRMGEIELGAPPSMGADRAEGEDLFRESVLTRGIGGIR